jgi:hypothetical protein
VSTFADKNAMPQWGEELRMAKPKRKPTTKKARYLKTGKADVTLHLEPRGGRVTLSVILPASISKILARRIKKRLG